MKRDREDDSLPHGPEEFPWQEMLPEHREVIVRDFLDVFTQRAFSLTCSREFLRWYPTTSTRMWKRDNFSPTPIQILHALGRWAPWGYIVNYLGTRYHKSMEFNNEIFNLYAGMIREGRDTLAQQCLKRGADEYPPEDETHKRYEFQHLGLVYLQYRSHQEFDQHLRLCPTLVYAGTRSDIVEAADISLHTNITLARTNSKWKTMSDDECHIILTYMLEAPMTMDCYDPGDSVPMDWPLLLNEPEMGEKLRRIVSTRLTLLHLNYWQLITYVDNWCLLWSYLSSQEQDRIRAEIQSNMFGAYDNHFKHLTYLDKLCRALQVAGVTSPSLFELFQNPNRIPREFRSEHWYDPAMLLLLDHYHKAGTLDLSWLKQDDTETHFHRDGLFMSMYWGVEFAATRVLERLHQWFKEHPFPGSAYIDAHLNAILHSPQHEPRRYTRDETLILLVEAKH
jgi:hypothetical protein